MEFIKAFEEIDKDESGEITRSELEEYMKAKNYKPAFVEKWLRIFDIDNSGTITLEEFCNTLGLIPGKKQKERIKRRNTLRQLELETKDKEKNKLNEDENKILETSNSKEDENKMITTKKNVTITINTTIKTTNQNESVKEKDNLNINENGKMKNLNTDEDDKSKKMGNINTDLNGTESKSNREINKLKDETDKKDSNIKKNDKDNVKDSENRQDSLEEIEYKYKIKKYVEETDEVQVIAEDPDINDILRDFVLKLSLDSARMFDEPLEMAKNVKRNLDANFNRSWHVVAGRDSYGCLVTHEEGRFIHVRAREWGILMWQVYKT